MPGTWLLCQRILCVQGTLAGGSSRNGLWVAHTWNMSRVTTIFQLAKCHGLVMYTRGAADAREHMLSANIKLWKGPACSRLL